MTMMFPLVGFQMMSSNYFQSTGQPMKASLLSLTRQVLFLIPLLLLLPSFLPGIIGCTSLQAVCFTYPTADVLSVVTTAAFIIPEIIRLNKREKQAALSGEDPAARFAASAPAEQSEE
jgi:Na+-driven multidrug efflux pump